MSLSTPSRRWFLPHWCRPARQPAMRWTLGEAAGGLGDLGTFLPISLMLAIACGMDFGWLLIMAGLMNILSGWWFRQPIPVQPMKALAAVAITAGLSPGSIAAGGLGVGLILLIMASSNLISWIHRWVPRGVVSGLQLGVGLSLASKACQSGGLQTLVTDASAAAWILTLGCAALLALGIWKRWPLLLPVFVLGLILAGWQQGWPTWQLPRPHILWPDAGQWQTGLLHGTLPQLPLTLLNSVVAVCALSSDLYPKRGIAPRHMTLSVAAMNLLCVPLGGMPMCHGSGGLAAQHQFGARSGASVILLGIGKIIAGLLFGAGLAQWLAVYPASLLGLLMLLAGLSLAYAGRRGFTSPLYLSALPTAAGIVWLGTLYGFLIGMACVLVINLYDRTKPSLTGKSCHE